LFRPFLHKSLYAISDQRGFAARRNVKSAFSFFIPNRRVGARLKQSFDHAQRSLLSLLLESVIFEIPRSRSENGFTVTSRLAIWIGTELKKQLYKIFNTSSCRRNQGT